MSTDAQRARNKRKRDKQRDKRRALGANPVRRMRLVLRFFAHPDLVKPYHEGLLSKADYLLEYQQRQPCEAETGWLESTCHDVSSHELDAITMIVDQWFDALQPCAVPEVFHDVDADGKVTRRGKFMLLVDNGNGETRRQVWHVTETDVAAEVIAAIAEAVCS